MNIGRCLGYHLVTSLNKIYSLVPIVSASSQDSSLLVFASLVYNTDSRRVIQFFKVHP